MAARQHAAAPRPTGGRALRGFLEPQESLLVASAVAAGLGRIRTRSAPLRLAFEAQHFVHLLATFLAHEPGQDPGAAAAAEVRSGALAAACAAERRGVLALWAQVLEPIVSRAAGEPGTARLHDALSRIRRAVEREARKWDAQRIDVVVVGASAGGLGALMELFAAFDSSFPATVLVALHMSDHARGLVPQLLARHSGLRVAWAADGAALQLGHAFVAPPSCHLVVRGDALAIVEGPPVRYVRPSADTLFASAAEAYGSRVAAVILSGTGHDGSAGIQAVRGRGGLTFAQDPASAEFKGMPDAAIATGSVQRVLRGDRLGEALRSAVERGRSRATRGRPAR